MAQHRGHVRAHQVDEELVSLASRKCGESVRQFLGRWRTGRRRPAPDPDQPPEQRGHRSGARSQRGGVQSRRDHDRSVVRRQRRVEQGESLARAERTNTEPAQPPHIGLSQVPGHARAVLPEAPRH